MADSLYKRFCRSYVYKLIANEINSFGRYFDSLTQITPVPGDDLQLFNACVAKQKSVCENIAQLRQGDEKSGEVRLFLINGNCNHSHDIAAFLGDIRKKLSRQDRLAIVFYNPYLRWLFILANKFGFRKGPIPTTFCTQRDVANIVRVAGYESLRGRPVAYIPFSLLGIGTILNRIFQAMPIIRWLGLSEVVLLRPVIQSQYRPSLSVIIPARNERGNILQALKRMPNFEAPLEVIFVEGNSTDGTWEEIQTQVRDYKGPFEVKAVKQTGKGKNDAVRLGFSLAKHEILTILDADLTMPPEQLPKFYEAYLNGHGDFINGNRLVYPMEGEAMRFLNHLANVFFAKFLSFVLETNLGDSLCGTKMMTKRNYLRFVDWRNKFGDFDPFGDFELIFPACVLGLGVVDMPVHYKARTYGTTNIHRFRHGLILLKMTLIGLYRIRLCPDSD